MVWVFVSWLVYTCTACDTYRKRRRSHQTGDYAVMDNFDSGSFQSIPYRQDGLPECPIYHNLGENMSLWDPSLGVVPAYVLSLFSPSSLLPLFQQEK